MAGDEGVGMSWTVAQEEESGDIACVMRTEKIEDALAIPYEPVTSVAYGGPEQVAFFDAITKVHRQTMGSRSHYCVYSCGTSSWRITNQFANSIGLHIMATHPAQQGRGAARALLQYLADIADDTGLPVYLEATPEAVPVYRKFGWLETGATEPFPVGAAVNPAPMVVTMMLREPRARDI